LRESRMTSQSFQRKTSMKTCRDIALFERHWAWLPDQPRGISATLHLLVEDAPLTFAVDE
ncbi:MAG: DUF2239 family protein, partial [Pandoraea sp.]|nr:DUF2239 family protein [Pandoraea sp.]